MPPGRFLSDAEIERLEGWPETIERRDVVRFFAPAGEDLAFVREQRGAANQLAVVLQLGALRWLGFVPEDLAAAPPDAVTALAATLDVPARAIFDYAVRAQTRGEHRLLVRSYAGFRPFGDRELGGLGGRFVDAALEHERPSLLLARLCEILRADRVERPSVAGVIKKYVERAPGARPHIPVDRTADVSVFETIAARYPVFRITTRHRQI